MKLKCHICGGPVGNQSKSGACSRCNVIYRNKGLAMPQKPNNFYCTKCNTPIANTTKSYLCKSCAFSGENHPFFGKNHSIETKLKISKNRKGKKIPREAALRSAKNRSGEKHHSWNGGSFINKDGYRHILMPDHPNCYKLTGYVLEHRVIVEKYIGRYLLRNEDVHHIDGNRINNHINNLMVFRSRSSHRRYEESKPISPEEIVFDGRKICT